MVARTLLDAGVPVVLVTPGDTGELVLELTRPTDLVEVWTQRTLTQADPVRLLRLASAVRANLRADSGLEPVTLLLTQPWFGADEDVPPITGLRGLFVQYPRYDVRPALAAHCERWHSLPARQTAGLASILGQLLG